MSRRVAVWIACDAVDCDVQMDPIVSSVVQSVEPVREKAASLGWERRRIGMRFVDLCPVHVSVYPKEAENGGEGE